MSDKPKFSLKDEFFNPAFIAKIATAGTQFHPDFLEKKFLAFVLDKDWEARELMDRMRHITASLHKFLPLDFADQIDILKKMNAHLGNGFEMMFFPDFVQKYGLDHFDISVDALAFFTPFGSSEFGVRPFIKNNPEKMMAKMNEWSRDKDEHVRRLASEGCRPKLPWGMALNQFRKDPNPILPILERLKNDPSEYVRRSVANNLNDISKDHPELVLAIAHKWMGKTKETDKLVKHALRTLLKSGNQEAMHIFGFRSDVAFEVKDLALSQDSVPIGGEFRFSFELYGKPVKPTSVRLEYAVYYFKKNGSQSRKVFQLKETNAESYPISILKKQHFVNLTTRKHYPGPHKLAIIINGKEVASIDFELLLPA